ncbi:succinyl-CoA synthetase [Paenibacillus sp. 481]|nr:succinyl-CoA synthetase [Paenibacillus sp. 481]
MEIAKKIAYEDGYRKGKYEGGEGFLTKLIPDHMILPEIPVDHVINLGYEKVRHLLKPLVDPFTVYMEMHQALNEKKPLSVVRLGDGELLALAHDKVLSPELVRKEGTFLSYSGMNIPDHKYRDQLAEAVRRATFVGIPTSRQPNFQALLYPVFRAYDIDVMKTRFTYSTVNYLLASLGYLLLLMQNRKILVVGNEAQALADVLTKRSISVTGVVSPVKGVQDIPRVLDEISTHTFDLALVAAGIPAVIISQHIAQHLGKVALDFGHLANNIAKGVESF